MVDWPSVWTGSPQLAASCRLSSCVSFSTNTPLCPFIDCCVCVYFFCLCTLFFVLLVFSFFLSFYSWEPFSPASSSWSPRGPVFSPCRGSFLVSLWSQEFMHVHTEMNDKEQRKKETNKQWQENRCQMARRQRGREKDKERERAVMKRHKNIHKKTNALILNIRTLRLWLMESDSTERTQSNTNSNHQLISLAT